MLKLTTIGIIFAIVSNMAQAEKTTNKASMEQTEAWMEQHIQAWDDNTRVEVEAQDCKLKIFTHKTASVVNMKGLLFPIEVLAINDRSPRVRIRVKDRYTGDYGVTKECPNNAARLCKNSDEKWSPLSYYDFTITHELEYFGRDEDLNKRKATSLRNALNHYANLCGAKEWQYSF